MLKTNKYQEAYKKNNTIIRFAFENTKKMVNDYEHMNRSVVKELKEVYLKFINDVCLKSNNRVEPCLLIN